MRRVLLVDDEHNLRRLLAAVLTAAGMVVTQAASSPEALALARTGTFDVLVTDVHLEEMDGPTLAHHMVENNPSLLVVFISGYPLDIEAEKRAHPYCDFVQKPFPPKALLKAIRALQAAHSDR